MTEILSKGIPNRWWASMTSSPLLIRVEELMVMTCPIDQVGCAIASPTVTSDSSPRCRPRNGPPVAVITSCATSPREPLRRAWAMAECSESTGTISPALAISVTKRPPTIRDSLLARASVVPARSVASGDAKPNAPSMVE